jgi:hypothetical protein
MAETLLDNEHVMFLTSSATKTGPNPVIYVSLSVKEIIHMEQDRHIEKGCSTAAAAAGWVRGDSGRGWTGKRATVQVRNFLSWQ